MKTIRQTMLTDNTINKNKRIIFFLVIFASLLLINISGVIREGNSEDIKNLLSLPVKSEQLYEKFLIQSENEGNILFKSKTLSFMKFVRNISRKEYKKDVPNNYICIGEIVPDYQDACSYKKALSSKQEIEYKIVLIVIYYINNPDMDGKGIFDCTHPLLPIRVRFFANKRLEMNKDIYFNENDISESYVYSHNNRNGTFDDEYIQRCLDRQQIIIPVVRFTTNQNKNLISTRKKSKNGTGLEGENANHLLNFFKVFPSSSTGSLSEILDNFSQGAFFFKRYNYKRNSLFSNGKSGLMIPYCSALNDFFDLEKELHAVYRTLVKPNPDYGFDGDEKKVRDRFLKQLRYALVILLIKVLIIVGIRILINKTKDQ